MTDQTGPKEFQKFDKDKLRWDKFCWRAAEAVLRIMHFGSKKARGEDNERMLRACCRHIVAHLKGEVLDPESGKPHLWHAACTLMMHIDNDIAAQEEKVVLYPGKPITVPGVEPQYDMQYDITKTKRCSYGRPENECWGPYFKGEYSGQLIPCCNPCWKVRGHVPQ
jgi:hypothetical protein